jgi:hypothetical protein
MQHSRIVSSGRYRETEVRALVENYAALLNERDTTARGLRALVAVADVKRVWHRLTPGEQEVILVMGLCGVSSREAALYYAKSYKWAQREYKVALENLTWLMNGGD